MRHRNNVKIYECFCLKFSQKSITQPLVYTSAALTRGGQGGAQCRPPEQPETEQKRRFPRYAACGKPPFIFVFTLRSSGFAAFLLVFVRFRQRKIAPYASIGAKTGVYSIVYRRKAMPLTVFAAAALKALYRVPT